MTKTLPRIFHTFLLATAVVGLLLSGYAVAYSQSPAVDTRAQNQSSPVRQAEPGATSLHQLLQDLHQRDGISITYQSDVLDDTYVSAAEAQAFLAAPREDREAMLRQWVQSHGLRFKKYSESLYIIFQRAPAPEPDVPKVAPPPDSKSQAPLTPPPAKVLSGQVINLVDNLPLPGVNIMARGTTVGTVTDVAGRYQLSVPTETEALAFSSVGFASEEVAIGNQTVIDVGMVPDIQSLQEVVVVGYGTQKKSDLTGAVSSVEPAAIQDMAVPTLDQAIQGRAAGVYVSRNDGSPGSGAQLFIRGAGSIQGTDPLWIIDGVRTSPGPTFNMNDVESIEILKDASAAAIYGSAAANGVIIVTTKRGEEGKTVVNLNAYAGVSSALGLPEALTTPQYAAIKNEAYDLAGTDRIPAYADPDHLPSPSTDWLDVLYGRGGVQNYDVSVSGGGETSAYFVSGGYFEEIGTYVGTAFKRYSLRANSDFSLGDRLKIGESIFLNYALRDPMNGTAQDWIRATPALPVRDAANRFGGYGTVDRLAYQYEGGNPLANELRTDQRNQDYRVGGNVYLELQVIKNLHLRTSLGANVTLENNRTFQDTYLGGGGVIRSTASLLREYEENVRLLGNVVLNYDTQLGKHRLGVLVGYEAIRTDAEQYTASGANLTGNIRVLDGADPESGSVSGGAFSDGILSQFGRINYSFDDTYLFTANVRRDGSSQFGPAHRYGVFPSASVGWRIAREGFMRQASFLSDLKLRASYGVLGNSDGLSRYLYEASYTTDGTLYTVGQEQGVVQGISPSRFPNRAIRWEEIATHGVGLDAAALHHRLTFTADYYVKTTNNLLLTVGLPPSAGYLPYAWYRSAFDPVINIGQIQNKGWEMAVAFRNKPDHGLAVTLSANAAYNQNKVTQLNEDERILSGVWEGAGRVSVTEVGKPLGFFYGYVVEGIIQDQAELDALNESAPDGFYLSEGTGPGDFRYRDIGRFDENGHFIPEPDGEITNADQTFIGNPWPRWIYGFNADLTLGNVDLSLFFQGVAGVDRFNGFKSLTHNLFSDYNLTTGALGRWTPEHPTHEQPRIIRGDPNGNRSRVSSYFVEDGSYLRLKNVQLGYTVPAGRIPGVTTLRVYGSVQNLLTFTRYGGFDPEFGAVGVEDNNTNWGIDRGQYPQSRIVTVGVQLAF